MKPKLWMLFIMLGNFLLTYAQDDTTKVRALEVYGFAQTDIGYNFNQINPAWSDALRVTKLPTYKNQYAPDGNVYFSARQSRLGVRGWTPTPVGELKVVFEFDMFGVGVDEGQFTMRPRNFYGELGRFLVGQANSPFMDGDIWPNTMEYWGPTGMVFFRNLQFRYAILQGDNELFVALERPGASADQGSFSDRTELDSVKGHFNVPDFSAHYKRSGKWGHVQLGGMLRSIKWKDIHTTGGYDLSGSTVGWGLNLSTVINVGKMDAFRGSIIYGQGVENYMQDAPVDVGIELNQGNTTTPIKGKALPVTGIVAFYDHYWTPNLCTAFGYSSTSISNTDYGSPNAYKFGQYAIVNLVATPFKNVTMAAELEWGKRKNFSDGFSSQATKLQFSFKYNFSQVFYRKK
ncbi:MAG TPA: DcaP family trimeric outer membrane transporter [Puia sp.]|nr:DcaP family trimeric outer membrane transporter [Puia sp.]